jgi:ParB family transcriptional regulator, chromosome partitioning protein
VTIPPENSSASTQAHEDGKFQLRVVPSNLLTDLLTPPEAESPNHGAAGPSATANAPARLRAETAPVLKPPNSSVDANQPPATGHRGPRLERVPTLAIQPAASMPRQRVEPLDIAALTESVKRNGLAQPLLVRANASQVGKFELFAGYRRWRAALAANLDYVPVIVFDHLSEVVALELNLLENLNRRDMTIIEEAEAFRVLVERYGRTAEQIAALAGRSCNQVMNMLCLVALPEEVRLRVRKGQISFEHGRVLVGTPDPTSLARRIVAEGLTVRETKQMAAQLRSTTSTHGATVGQPESPSAPTEPEPAASGSATPPADIRSPNQLRVLQAALRTAVGTEIEVRFDRDDSAVLIEGRSVHETANVVFILCEALRLLRTNTSATSQRMRPGS